VSDADGRPKRAKWERGGPSPNLGGRRKQVTPADAPKRENSGRNPDGTFAKGNSVNLAGKPKGARHKATLAMEALLDGEADVITRKAIELAKAGDLIAIRICMDRLLPPRRERPVNVALPKISVASDLIAAAAALTDAVALGEVTPGEAASLSTLVGNVAKAVETFELSERLAKLEKQMATKGSTP
jgi:hypothetical protein